MAAIARLTVTIDRDALARVVDEIRTALQELPMDPLLIHELAEIVIANGPVVRYRGASSDG